MARTLPAGLDGLLAAADEVLQAAAEAKEPEAAAVLHETASGRGALLQKLEEDAHAALAAAKLDHATMAVPRWALADPEGLAALTNEQLRLLALQAVVERAMEHAANLAASHGVHEAGENLEGVPADLDTLLDTPFAWLPGSLMEKDPVQLGADVDGALVAASMAYWVGNTSGITVLQMKQRAAQKLGAARRQLHEPVWVHHADVAPTVIVKMPKPKVSRPTFFVAPCGSRKSIGDWWCNSRTDLVDAAFGGGAAAGKSHEGFWDAYAEQRDAVFAALADQRGVKAERVVFCGHSLGGAVARLLALDWATQQRAAGDAKFCARLITFGTPRGGDVNFQKAVTDLLKYKRVRTRWDPVPSVPRSYVQDEASEHWVVYPTRQDEGDMAQDRSGGRSAEKRRLLGLEEAQLEFRWIVTAHREYEYASALLRHFRNLGWAEAW